jgi:hypothetical protein
MDRISELIDALNLSVKYAGGPSNMSLITEGFTFEIMFTTYESTS